MPDKSFLSDEDRRLAEELESLAESLIPSPSFEHQLEVKLMQAHSRRVQPRRLKPMFTALAEVAALAALVLLLSLVIRAFRPQPQPAAGSTPAPSPAVSLTPTSTPTPDAGPTPTVYTAWGGTLVLNVPLPNGPEQATVYAYQPAQPATEADVRALADRLGLTGPLYRRGGAFFLVDGNRRLRVESGQVFEYLPDYSRYPRWARLGNSPATFPPDAEAQIRQFLDEHGFDFAYEIRPAEVAGGYFAALQTPDGHPICYEDFRCAGLLFTLDEQGILSVDGDLPQYQPLGQYPILSAEEAFQKVLNPDEAGILQAAATLGVPHAWYRTYPTDQTITYYGWLDVIPAVDGGAPLILLNGYPATGHVADMQRLEGFVKARGRFRRENGTLTFQVESWQPATGLENVNGTITRQADGSGLLTTPEGVTLTLPDLPADLPLPLENAFVLGVRQGDTFEWVSIDLRNQQHGGGGSTVGQGFYRLNLTGTPVPFPTPGAATPAGGGEQTYTVQPGDTLSQIASRFGVTVQALMEANHISADDADLIRVGQVLVIPGPATPAVVSQVVEGLRGMLSITRYKLSNGSERMEYLLYGLDSPYPMLSLQGENLEALQPYQNRPVDVWGTIEATEGKLPVLHLERYEIPFPNLEFQVLQGTVRETTLNGTPVNLFTTTDGQTYVQLTPDGHSTAAGVGRPGDRVQIEALLIPGETFGGYPALRVFSAGVSNGDQPDLSISASEIPVVDLSYVPPEAASPPKMTIEHVELIAFMPDPIRAGELPPEQRYIQPAWLFSGHYASGEAFFILVQALRQEYLAPEVAPIMPPG